ncbi:MAG: chorismate--pyruvate lyase family protein [Gammaproteobacteria bacterium]
MTIAAMDESEQSVMRQAITAPEGGRWRALAAWPDAERPTALWPWLTHSGSLTQKLRELAGAAFHVEVLRESGTELGVEDAQLLAIAPGSTAQLREVYLCGTQPLVFGRTLAPDHGAARWLERLGAQPLGDRVFADQDTARGEIEVQRVTASDAFYRAAVRGLAEPPGWLWARRSVLRVKAARLLIYECFLPGVTD